MDQGAEILDGDKVIGTLHGAIESRRACKMEIPNTEFGWITIILGIHSQDNNRWLLIDKVAGFEKAISKVRDKEIAIDFIETDGVPCHFKTRVMELRPEALWVELPQTIFRMQKRRFYRVKARLGTEVAFDLSQGKQEKAKVRDYSMGGVAFLMERHLTVHLEDQVTNIQLSISQGDEMITFRIPSAVVRRIEHQPTRKDICVLEFMEMPETVKEQLWRHIFEEQRMLLKRTKRI